MAFMEWTDKFSIGIAVFDDEHKKLIAIINSLYEHVSAGADKLTLQRVSDALVEYTLTHFRHEEDYFEEWGFPDANEHIKDHEELRRKVFEYRKAIAASQPAELAADMLRFLRSWLAQHILVADKKYGAFLLEKGFH